MKLTNTAVLKTKPEAKPFKLVDGGGMYLQVMPNGSKYWRLAYRFAGKQKTLALGVYPDTTLAEARARREEARKVLANGGDPGAVKKAQKRQSKISAANSFEIIARELHKLKSPIWSENHADNWIGTLEREIFPKFGGSPITDIDAPMVLEAIRAIEGRGASEVASRSLQRVRAVCAYAIATGRARHNPAAEIKGALAPKPKVKHFAAIAEKEMPEFLRAVAAYQGFALTSLAFRLLLLTFVRTSEMRKAKWNEFNLDAGLWVIPAERMKAREPHTVPLSSQTIAVLHDLESLTGDDDYLFPGRNRAGTVISENTILKVIERIGYKERMTGHGIRTIASTYLNGVGMIRPDIIESQLAHAEKNSVRAAYNQADYMAYRKAMMQFWADTLDAWEQDKKLPDWLQYEPHGLYLRAAQVIRLHQNAA